MNIIADVAHFEDTAPTSGAPIGRVVEVHGPVVDIVCEILPPLHRALTVAIDGGSAVLEVLHHLDPHQVRAIAFSRTAGLKRGTPVSDSGAPQVAKEFRNLLSTPRQTPE